MHPNHTHRSLDRTPSLDRSSLSHHLWALDRRQPSPPCLDSGPPCLVSVKLYPDMQCTRLNHTHRSLGRRLSPSPCPVRVKLYPDMQCTRTTPTGVQTSLTSHLQDQPVSTTSNLCAYVQSPLHDSCAYNHPCATPVHTITPHDTCAYNHPSYAGVKDV